LNVDIFAIRKASDGKMIAPLGSQPFNLAAGEVVQAMVVIQNKNIGHSLVPEVRDLYEAWVEFHGDRLGWQRDLPQRLSSSRMGCWTARTQLHQSPSQYRGVL
jgi:hypothetical protein